MHNTIHAVSSFAHTPAIGTDVMARPDPAIQFKNPKDEIAFLDGRSAGRP